METVAARKSSVFPIVRPAVFEGDDVLVDPTLSHHDLARAAMTPAASVQEQFCPLLVRQALAWFVAEGVRHFATISAAGVSTR